MLKSGITQYKNGYFCIYVRMDGKRYKYYNGSAVGIDLKPNLQDGVADRKRAAKELLRAFNSKILEGWRPVQNTPPKVLLNLEKLQYTMECMNLSAAYRYQLTQLFKRICGDGAFTEDKAVKWFEQHLRVWSAATHNSYLRHLRGIEKQLRPYGYSGSAGRKVKMKRCSERLHVPFRDVDNILQLISCHDEKLYLCCLLMYGCFLRPHREIRLLRRKDFSDDYRLVSIGGVRVKNGNNRVIPVPNYVRQVLLKLDVGMNDNIFSRQPTPYNPGYFKLKWRRFAMKVGLNEGETMYSIRHNAALYVYQKQGNLHLLQSLMGHSRMESTLKYLRGHSVTRITENLLPQISDIQ